MKEEEEIILTDNNQNKNLLNSLISYNNNNHNDFKKINSSNNIINTSGSHPIVIFKKISKSLTQTFANNNKKKENKPLKKNYINDGGLRKKINKYKSVLSNANQLNPTSANLSKSNKNIKGAKTMRNGNKKIIANKREKLAKSKEKTQIKDYYEEKNDKIRDKKYSKRKVEKVKSKEKNKTEYHSKESHSQGHFNRKNNILGKHFISKNLNGINHNISNNNFNNNTNNINNAKIQKNLLKKKNNVHKIKKSISNYNIDKKDIKENNNKKEIQTQEIEEYENLEQRHRKIEYVDALIKNGILNITKEFNLVKKLTPKEILTRKKRDFLQENGITEIIINDDEKKYRLQSQLNLNNFNIKSIRKKNISTKNSIKRQTNNKLNISKSNSRFVSFLNNNTNITNNNINNTNTNLISNQETQVSNKNLKKKISLKPQINQFEYINKIQQEQKKLIEYNKNENTTRGLEKYFQPNDYEHKLSDSFRHTTNANTNYDKYYFRDNKKNNLNKERNSAKYNHIKKENRQKLIEEFKDDEFPFSHRKSYRSKQEIYKYLKEKRIEIKKEEENTEKEKQLKAYMTFQNLINIGKKLDNNITKLMPQYLPMKNRKENKGHMKLRKEPNEYYVGTESSKNNSTFIDKKEYYLSILESQKYVNQSKIKQDEDNLDKDKKNQNDDIFENSLINKEKNIEKRNKIREKKLIRGFSSELFENKNIMDKLYTTINKANQIFSRENLNKIKNNILKRSSDTRSMNFENDKIIITTETENNDDINNINYKITSNSENNNSSNHKKLNSQEIKFNIRNEENKTCNINSCNQNCAKDIILNNKKNNLFNYSFSYNNLNLLNSKEIINKALSNAYSNTLNQMKKNENKIEPKTVISFVNKLKIILKRNIFTFIYKLYLEKYTRKTYTMAFNYIVVICKIYPFRKIEKYTRVLEYFEAFKELFKPFIHYYFRKFIINCLELKIRKFILILETFYKYKAMNKLFIYCERDFKKEIINYLIITIKKPFYDYFFNKLNLFKIQNNNKLGIPLNNILLNQIINQNETKIEKDKENFKNKKDMIKEEVINDENNNIFNSDYDYYSLTNNNNQNININNNLYKHIKPQPQKEEINTHVNIKDLIYIENKDYLKKLGEIKDPEKFSEEITNIILEQIIKTEIKPFSPMERIIPYKSFKYDILPKSQNTSLNNSYISSSCASLDQVSLNTNNSVNDPRIQALNESLLSQMSYNSEFNKTVRDKKREQSVSIYAQKIGPKLVEFICEEIKKNYNRIYDNISTPLRTDFEEIIIALELKDNEQLKQNYRILQVKEELKDIINRENLIKKFAIINKKIRKKYNQYNFDECFDIFLNLSVIDTAIEIINKERFYGEIGEPFSFYSLRTREIGFKYNRNEPKKLIQLVYNSLMDYLNNPIFLIKDSVINADEKKIIKCFKKDLEENECQWEDIEIIETQSKLEVTELILDQLYNEVIEILEHVQLNRKMAELYQNKSIYACEDIPKLSFQQTTTENDLIQEGEGREIISP